MKAFSLLAIKENLIEPLWPMRAEENRLHCKLYSERVFLWGNGFDFVIIKFYYQTINVCEPTIINHTISGAWKLIVVTF